MNFGEDGDEPPASVPYGWVRHAAASIAPEDFPTAPGPMVYEGFVPQQDQETSQYPSLDLEPLGVPDFNRLDEPILHTSIERSTPLRDLPAQRGQRPGRTRGRRRQAAKGGWNRGAKTGPRPVIDPGDEFKALHKQATEAFIEQQDYDKALETILKAISINPEIYSAHVLLSEIYFAKDDDERGVAALFSGAHASPNDPAVWHQLADVCLQRSSVDRLTMLRQAGYCFQRLLQIDKQDHDARFQKAAISRELGHHTKALKDLDYLLQKLPHNSSVLRSMAEVCLDINDIGKAIGLYDDALEYHHLNGSTDEESFSWTDLIVYVDLIARPNGPHQAMKVLKSISRWLLGREEETYWDTFTDDDREWDPENHPRRNEVESFQPDQYPLDTYGTGLPLEIRMKLGDLRLKTGYRQEALTHFEWLLPEERAEGTPLHEYTDLFLQVADALREVKEYEQALRYYEALHSINACDDVEFWLGLGACSYVCEKKDQALYCYEEAKSVDPTSGEARTQLSKLYAASGDREKALVLAREAITLFEGQLPKTERRKYERRDLREAREAAQKAYKAAYKIPKPRNGNDSPAPKFSRRALDKARRLAKEAANAANEREDEDEAERRSQSLEPPQRQNDSRDHGYDLKKLKKRRTKAEKTAQQRYDNAQQLYSTLCTVTEAMREGDDVARNIWLDCAEALIEEFRQQKAFYPGERYLRFQGFDHVNLSRTQTAIPEGRQESREDMPVPSVESNVPIDYLGIVFPNWLDIFLEQAIVLANMQEDSSECYATITAAIDCNVWYHDLDAMVQIHTCWLACTIALHDDTTLFNTVLRWFMREFVFCTDTYRLFAALNFFYPFQNDKAGKSGQMSNAAFRSAPNQKFLFRQIMSLDAQLPEGYGADHPDGPVPDFVRKPSSGYIYISDRRKSNGRHDSITEDELGTRDTMADSDEDDAISTNPVAHRTYNPKELDVVLFTLYAQVLYSGQSFPNALSYFYRAYSLEPDNPVVLLSIAFCYIHQMFKRQNENRHMYLLQGYSFFEKYVKARTAWAEHKEQQDGTLGGTLIGTVKREIEFNRARCWQMLGMSDLAIRSYTGMMDLKNVKREDDAMDVDEDGGEDGDCHNKEAAYAMMTIYASNGDMDSAREIQEKYLVIE